MNTSSKLFGCGLALAGLYLAIGCTSTTTGNEGNLDFSYAADDDVRNFNKPIAVGAKLQLKVKETGTAREVDVTDAMTEDNTVLSVETFSSDRVVVVGTGAGATLIEVSAKVPSGDVVSDSVNMLAAVPDVLELRHTCGDNSKYFAGSDGVLVGFDMKKANGQDVIGYGYFPIEVVGEAELTLNETSTSQAHFQFDVGAMPGVSQIKSTLDDTVLDFEVVLPSDVDGIMGGTSGQLDVAVGSTKYVTYYPAVGESRICQSEVEIQATSNTPEICDVRAVGALDPDDSTALDIVGSVAIEGKAIGDCAYSVSFPDGAGGAGVSVDFEASVTQGPAAGTDEMM